MGNLTVDRTRRLYLSLGYQTYFFTSSLLIRAPFRLQLNYSFPQKKIDNYSLH